MEIPRECPCNKLNLEVNRYLNGWNEDEAAKHAAKQKASKATENDFAELKAFFLPSSPLDNNFQISPQQQQDMSPISLNHPGYPLSGSTPKFESISESNDIYYYKGEANKFGQWAGKGYIMHKIFFGIYIGNLSLGHKHGFGINVTFDCTGKLKFRGYEWYQGKCMGKRQIPDKVFEILNSIKQGPGCLDLHQILEKACHTLPRSAVLERSDPRENNYLEDACVYRIRTFETRKPLSIYQGGGYEGCAVIQGADQGGSVFEQFIAKRIQPNIFAFFPSSHPCKALDANDGKAQIQSKVVLHTYDRTKKTQMWRLIKNNDDSLSLINEESGLYLSADKKSFDLYLRPVQTGEEQRFMFDESRIGARDNNRETEEISKDSLYSIRNVMYGKYFDIDSGKKENGTKLLAWNGHGGENQIFKFIKGANNTYYIQPSFTSGSVLNVHIDLSSPSEDNLTITIHSKKGNLNNQLWKVKRMNGYCLFESAFNNLCIEQTCDSTIKMRPCDVLNKAQWFALESTQKKPRLHDGQVYYIKLRKEPNYIEIDHAGKLNSSLQKGYLAKSVQQRFRLKYFGDDVYTLIPLYNETYAVGIKDESKLTGVHLVISQNRNSEAQKFTIVYNHDGTYSLINKNSGLAIDALDNQRYLQQMSPGNSPTQCFHFELCE